MEARRLHISDAHFRAVANRLGNDVEFVVPGHTVELQSMGAALEFIECAYAVPEDVVLVRPAVAASLSGPDDPDMQNVEVVAFLNQISNAAVVLIPIWSARPHHFTYMEAHRTGEGWGLVYSDSLRQVSRSGVAAAKRVARRLGFIENAHQFPAPSFKGEQQDGWSCGLWVTLWIEEKVANVCQQPFLQPSIVTRVQEINNFICGVKRLGQGVLQLARIHGKRTVQCKSCSAMLPANGSCCAPACPANPQLQARKASAPAQRLWGLWSPYRSRASQIVKNMFWDAPKQLVLNMLKLCVGVCYNNWPDYSFYGQRIISKWS